MMRSGDGSGGRRWSVWTWGGLALALAVALPGQAWAHETEATRSGRALEAVSRAGDPGAGGCPEAIGVRTVEGTHFHTRQHRVYHARGRYVTPWPFGGGTAGYAAPAGEAGLWPPVIVDAR